MKKQILVLALGNELCGEDGFGPLLLRRLRARPGLAVRARLLEVHTDLLEHLDMLTEHEQVVLLDAVIDPEQAGQVRVFREKDLSSWPLDAPSGHQLSPLLALRLFRLLHPGSRTGIRLVGLCVERVTLGQPPCSERILESAEKLVLELLSL